MKCICGSFLSRNTKKNPSEFTEFKLKIIFFACIVKVKMKLFLLDV